MRLSTPARTAAAVAVSGALAAVLAGPAHAATPTWRVVKTYNNAKYDTLNGVVALSRKDAWAFGGYLNKDGAGRPVAHHWNGKKWSPSPLPAGLTGQLRDGSALSGKDVWAFNRNSFARGDTTSYVLRWNGTKWVVAKKFGKNDGQLTGLLALSAKNVWVFGASGADQGVGTWHYNGRTWTRLQNAPAEIIQAGASSATNVWANARGLGGDSRTVVRFDGKRWKTVPTREVLPPEGDSVHSYVGPPLVRSVKEVWFPASTERYAGGKSTSTNVLLRWNGSRWQKYAVPSKKAPRQVVSDGQGGLWVLAGRVTEAAEVWHRSASGKWTRAKVSVPSGRSGGLADLALMPGSRSVVGAGELFPTNRSSSDGAIFYFKG